MFSAVFLVCFTGEPCYTFLDSSNLYESYEVCDREAMAAIERRNNLNLQQGADIPKVDYQCISWEKA